MKRETPPLDALEAFLQAARAASFREAADALAISPSAFSRRIQALEAFLGMPLFERRGSRPQLSEPGLAYLQTILPAIETIRQASAPFRGARGASVLRVMAPHSLSINWLVPRLPGFMVQAGDIDLALTVSRDLAPLRAGEADIAIVSGPREDWRGLHVERLAPLHGILVCAPTLVGGRPPPRQLSDLAHHRLLGVTWPHDLWGTWLSGVAYEGPALGEPVRYDTASLLYEAAGAGFGVTIGVPFLADRLLHAGGLVRVGGASAALGVSYYLACASEPVRRRFAVRAFSSWAHAQAEATVQAFHSLHELK